MNTVAPFQPPWWTLLLASMLATSTHAQTTNFIFPLELQSRIGVAEARVRAQELNKLSTQGNVEAVATQGADLVQASPQKIDGTLRLKIANSLAWTNRLPEAIEQYEASARDPVSASAARLPLANAYRWSGRADLALPLYNRVVASEPGNLDAQTGLEYAQRDARPRTTLEMGSSSDSGNLRLATGALRHKWRDASLTQVFEVETHLGRYKQGPTGPNTNSGGAAFSYENVASVVQPRVTVSADGKPNSGLFGELKLKMGSWPVHVDVGHENFGLTALSARALDAGLSANRIGVEGQWGGSAGVLSGRLAVHNISDGNQLRTGNVRFAPSWRPLGLAFKPYVSVDTRDVKFNTPNYWSPVDGSGSLGLGLTAEWSDKDWYLVLAGQAGTRLYGEAGTSWVGSVSGQRWIDKDTAVTVNLFGLSSVRDKARYRSHSLSVKLDRLW